MSLSPIGVPQEPGAFLRIEDKFFIPKALKTEFFDFLKTEMSLCRFGSANDFNINESIYFDSKDLDFFHHHFAPIKQRFKVRIRRYNPNHNDDVSYLEAKCKVTNGLDKITIKKRFKLDAQNYERIIQGLPILLSSKLRKLNSEIKVFELLDRVHLMNSLASTYFIKPQVKIRYERTSFEKNDLRITIDEGLSIESLNSGISIQSESVKKLPVWSTAQAVTHNWKDSQLLVEVKHAGTLPVFVQQFFDKHQIQKTSFSKYCWGIVAEMENS